jgi:hypothetical protein
VLANPQTAEPLPITVDVRAELRRAIERLPKELRDHFLTKAQGTELGELAWHYTGREAELRALASRLDQSDGGLRVVTGEPGSGKSALLGHLMVLADDDLVDGYARSGLAPQLAAAPRPPSGVFDAALHLTGKTLNETLHDVASQCELTGLTALDTASLVGALQAEPRRMTILADALDESQDPVPIADLLRRIAGPGLARVIVGTRRRLDEGPDRPSTPEQPTLLHALAARPDEIVALTRDRDAVHRYVERRIRAGPLADRAHVIAAQVASCDQPFLFARLATAELLARPDVAGGDGLRTLLADGHRGLFGAAVRRIAAERPAVAALLHALSLARGRGAPQTGGVWAAMAGALHPGIGIADDTIAEALTFAGAYITLDGEAGQSAYRLAHQTFAEHFRAQPDAGGEHRTVATALDELVRASGGWAAANFYAVRYLPEHLVADADRAPVDPAAVTALACDQHWLKRATGLFGIDTLLDVLGIVQRDAPPMHAVDVVTRALRRSRVALAADGDQLAAQLCGRLLGEPDAALTGLVATLGDVASTTWLRSRSGGMDWRADLDSTYTLGGEVWSLGFGTVDDRVMLAIGAGGIIEVRDPRRTSARVITAGSRGGQVTAAALGTLQRRPVVAFVANENVLVEDLRTGSLIAEPFRTGEARSVAIGLIDERPAVIATPSFARDESAIDGWYLDRLEWVPRLGTRRPERFQPAAVGVHRGRLVAFAVRPTGLVAMVDLTTGAVTASPPSLSRPLSGWELRFACAGILAGDAVVAAMLRTSAPPVEELIVTWRAPDGAVEFRPQAPTSTMLAAAIGELDGRLLLAVVSGDDPALVNLRELDRPMTFGQADQLASRARNARTERPPEERLRIAAVATTPERRVIALARLPRERDELTTWDVTDPARIWRIGATAAPAAAGRILVGDETMGELLMSADGRLRELGRTSALPKESFTLQGDDPAQWPTTVTAWCVVDGRPLMARGSFEGVVWIHDMRSGEVVAVVGGKRDHAEHRYDVIAGYPMNEPISAIALAQTASGAVLATASADRYDPGIVVRRLDGSRLYALADATMTSTLAAGALGSRDVLVTGSRDGAISVRDLHDGGPVCAITLDHAVSGVWIVRDARTICARDASGALHLFDLVDEELR